MPQSPEIHDDSLNNGYTDEDILKENAPDLEECHEEVYQEDGNVEPEFYSSPTVEYEPGKFNRRGLAGLLSPGAYWILRGKFSAGMSLNTFLTLAIILSGLVCIRWEIFPVPLSIFVLVLILAFWIYGCIKTIFSPKNDLAPISIKAVLAISFVTFWLPFILCLYIHTNFILQRTWMRNDTMLPNIMSGDVIFVDKLSHKFSSPSYGDLVFVEEHSEDNGLNRQRVYFGRIIACGGDEVQLFGVNPSVNHQKLKQYYRILPSNELDPSGITYEIPADTEVSEELDHEPQRWYPILAPQQVLFTQTNQVKLDPEFYYVLEDNRMYNQNDVKKRYGAIIHRSQIMGMPRFVLYNTETEHRFERYGILLK